MSPLKIVIVEDEALLALELEGIVEDFGHEVVGWATSSREARALVDGDDFDLAFVDIHLLDGATGIEVAEYIRDHHHKAVVFMTANVKRIPADFAGAIGVISKPYTLQGITTALAYLHEGVRTPPPSANRPSALMLSPGFRENWAATEA